MALSPEEITDCFARVRQALEAEPWYAAGHWLSSTHAFPETTPEGITFQLFKAHWFNQEHHGIHFESYLDFDPRRQKKSFVTLHLLHLPKLPGSAIPRRELARRVVDQIRPGIEAQWPGYVFRAGAYGQQPFVRRLDGSDPAFAATLAGELKRLCLYAGPAIDAVLTELGF
ncbi:MAG: hypothetical protein ACAI44_29185 [Candidatus Sericytochromatia bacterium]